MGNTILLPPKPIASLYQILSQPANQAADSHRSRRNFSQLIRHGADPQRQPDSLFPANSAGTITFLSSAARCLPTRFPTRFFRYAVATARAEKVVPFPYAEAQRRTARSTSALRFDFIRPGENSALPNDVRLPPLQSEFLLEGNTVKRFFPPAQQSTRFCAAQHLSQSDVPQR